MTANKVKKCPKEYLNMKPIYYYSITVFIYVLVIVLSILVEDVSLFYGIIGSTTTCFVVFTGPGSFYVISVHKKKLGFPDKKSVAIYVAAWVYFILGVCLSIGLNT